MNPSTVKKFRKQLIKWYHANHRALPWRETQDPYYIWVSEVMLQQTQVKTVLPYYEAFIRRFPDIESLAAAREQTVLKAWEGLGYYARCRNLHKAARTVRDQYGGRLPDDPATFRRLPGVGDYIAAAVQSIAFDCPLAVVDGNVKRVLARLFEIDLPVNQSSAFKLFQSIAQDLLDSTRPGLFNQAMMELGALMCTPSAPDCMRCPVRSACQAHRSQTVEAYPVRMKSRRTPEYHLIAGVISRNGKVLIVRRPSHGLLGGLWEFPGGRIRKSDTPQTACVREIRQAVNLSVQVTSHLTQVRHAYTHFRIKMDVFLCRYRSGSVKLNGSRDYRWVSLNALNRYPFSKASHKFIPLLET